MTAPTGNEGFLLAEDAAMKKLVSGMTVPNAQNPEGKPVQAWYRYPYDQREVTYPFITVELIGIAFAPDRAHSSGPVEVDYLPDLQRTGASSFQDYGLMVQTEFVPIDLTYQVATYARSPLDERRITYQLLSYGRLPLRHGWVHVPEDNTNRRLDNLGMQPADFLDEKRKTVFSKVHTLRMNAEITPDRGEDFRRVREVLFAEEFGSGNVEGKLLVY